MTLETKSCESIILENKVLPISFFERPAEIVAPELIGCKLVRRKENGQLLWGVIVETEAYSQSEPACHGYHRRSRSNETLFKNAGCLYVYLTYGIYHCVNVVTGRSNWANGVLLRAIALPNQSERIAAGPALLAKHFGLNLSHDSLRLTRENNLWISSPSPANEQPKTIVKTTRIGISKAKELPWRWYLKDSRSVSRRAKGDRCPSKSQAWKPNSKEFS